MKKLLTNFTGNVLAAGLHALGNGAAAHVQRDAQGVPTAWRIVAFGPLSITQDGATRTGEFLPEHADEIVAYHATKGERIPIDCEHYSKNLADLLGVEEPELAALLKGERAAAGFAGLEKRADGLWLTAATFVPRARLLMEQGMYGYFSPVFRGLVKPPLRITSVALTNTPAIDQLDSLAARAETDPDPKTLGDSPNQEGTDPMMEQLKKLLKLDPKATDADVLAAVQALQGETAGAADAMACAGEVATLLGLQSPKAAELKGALLALKAKADKSDADTAALSALTTRVQTMESAEAARRRQALIDQGRREGKLTPAMITGWAEKADEATLTAFLASAVVVAPPTSLVTRTDLAAAGDTVALTAEDRDAAAALGITADAFLAQKKAQAPKSA